VLCNVGHVAIVVFVVPENVDIRHIVLSKTCVTVKLSQMITFNAIDGHTRVQSGAN
jgi:hypothetical protein